MIGAFLSRAASNAATTVDEEVTFCSALVGQPGVCQDRITYDGWDGKGLLLSVVEELEHIIANDDASFPAEDRGSHCHGARSMNICRAAGC